MIMSDIIIGASVYLKKPVANHTAQPQWLCTPNNYNIVISN